VCIHIGEILFAILVCDCAMNIMGQDLCYQCNVIGGGTTGGMEAIHMCYKEGYFHYINNVNVLFD
jgi:hypothetical protein